MSRSGSGTSGTKIDFGDLSAFAGLSAFSVGGWFYFNSLASRQDVFTQWGNSGNRGFNLLVGVTASRAAFYFSNDGSAIYTTGADAISLVSGRWYHLGAKWNGSTVTLYRDGVAVVSAAAAFASMNNSTAGVRIGNGSETTENPINGRASRVAAWSSALTDDQFQELGRNASPATVAPGSLFFYAPLVGASSPEPDVIGGASGVVTSMTAASDPPTLGGSSAFHPFRSRVFGA